MEAEKILSLAVKALDSKKALNMSAIKVSDLTVITEYFVIATATSSTHVRSLAEEVEDKISKEGLEPKSIEGRATNWILIDYGSIIVHVFTQDAREFYNLDRIWDDGEHIDIDSLIGENED